MNILDQVPLALHNFEGPLDYLLHLVQKGEIDIYDVPLHLMTEQFVGNHLDGMKEESLEIGAEFVSAASTLVWMKSKRLLPQDPALMAEEKEEEDEFRFELLHKLVEYCRIKTAAKHLIEREKEQNTYFYRQDAHVMSDRPNGLNYLTLDDLSSLFQDALKRAASYTGKVYEEEYKVSDAIESLKKRMKQGERIAFVDLFHELLCREQLIVTFLAVLELMKIGTLAVVMIDSTPTVIPAE